MAIEGEHSEASAARKLYKSIQALRVAESALDRIVLVARKAVVLGSPEWRDVERMIAAGIVSDIAIDTIARVAPADGNAEREQVAIFELVAKAIDLCPDAHKPVCWAVTHNRKNGTTGGVGDVSGSAQRTGQADSVLLLAPDKSGGRVASSTVTFAKLREDPDLYPTPVTFAVTTDEHGGPVHDIAHPQVARLEEREVAVVLVAGLAALFAHQAVARQ